MSLLLITPPEKPAVALIELKEYLRIDTDDEQAVISRLLSAATTSAQRTTRRQFITATYELGLDGFPCGGRIELPNNPLQSVTSVKYTDSNGDEQTVDSDDYIVNTASLVGFVEPAFDVSWPIPQSISDSVKVRFICGYGDDGTSLPEDLVLAVKLLTSHWYEQRTPGSSDSISEVFMTVSSLLSAYVIPTFH